MSRPAIFLDKDGTFVVDIPYNVDPDRIVLAPRVPEGLRRLQEAGFALVIISNQAGVAHGYFGEAALPAVRCRIEELLAPRGIRLDGFYHCPHHPEGTVPDYRAVCDCRKSWPGLIRRAARELDLDLPRSWFIGDILCDIEAGRRGRVPHGPDRQRQ